MEREQIKHLLDKLVEEEIPSSEVSMWPTILKLIKAKKHQRFYGGIFFNQLSVYAQVAFSLSALVIVGIVIVLATPQGRVLAQAVTDYFTHTESDVVPREDLHLPTLPVTATQNLSALVTASPSPGVRVTETPEPGFTFDLSVSKAAELAGFEVLEPTWLPDVLHFVGASYDPDLQIVRIFYQYMPRDHTGIYADPWNYQGNGLVLREEYYQRTDDCDLCGMVGASAEIEKVQIGGAPGEYVVGVWNLNGDATWKNDPWLRTLRWQNYGIAFELQFMGPPEEITKEDMIAVAESIK